MNNAFRSLCSWAFLLCAFSFVFAACSTENSSPSQTAYQLALQEAMLSNEKVDSLVGGLHFGMTKAAFFDYCRNQQKLGNMNDGADNMVRIIIDSTAVTGSAVLEFYPGFNETGEINSMKGRMYSLQWAPWNKQYDAINMLAQGESYLQAILGGTEFKQFESAKANTLVKLDGNRRVLLYPHEYAQERLVFVIHNLDDAPKEVLEGIDVLPTVYPTASPDSI